MMVKVTFKDLMPLMGSRWLATAILPSLLLSLKYGSAEDLLQFLRKKTAPMFLLLLPLNVTGSGSQLLPRGKLFSLLSLSLYLSLYLSISLSLYLSIYLYISSLSLSLSLLSFPYTTNNNNSDSGNNSLPSSICLPLFVCLSLFLSRKITHTYTQRHGRRQK